MSSTEQRLIDFLNNSLNIDEDIDEDTELFSSGLLDSVAMMNVITFIEETERMEIHPADVTLENFDTVGRIARLVRSQS